MANTAARRKLHGLSKSERLCNFSFKNILFKEGNSIHVFPLKVYWKLIDTNLESIFFGKSVTEFQGIPSSSPHPYRLQNPSFPLKKIPPNALFTHPAKCLFGVSSKVHKSAVDRNHLKRILKESYRQNKAPFYSFLEGIDSWCLLALIYTAKPALPYHDIEAKIIVSLQKIQEKIIEHQNSDST
jgi:ribonuclease P protein component